MKKKLDKEIDQLNEKIHDLTRKTQSYEDMMDAERGSKEFMVDLRNCMPSISSQ